MSEIQTEHKNNNHVEIFTGESKTPKKENLGEGEVVIKPTKAPAPLIPAEPKTKFDGIEVAPGIFHHHYKVERAGLYEFALSTPACNLVVFNTKDMAHFLGRADGKLVLHLEPGSYLLVARVKESTTYIASFRAV